MHFLDPKNFRRYAAIFFKAKLIYVVQKSAAGDFFIAFEPSKTRFSL